MLVWGRDRGVCGVETHRTPGGHVPRQVLGLLFRRAWLVDTSLERENAVQRVRCVEVCRKGGGRVAGEPGSLKPREERDRLLWLYFFKALQEVTPKGTEQDVGLRERAIKGG